jgi:aminoglycoside phosphotransferase (APT) family kinase protein
MMAEPDGVEVVRTAAEAATLAIPPLLVLDTLEAYLDEHELGSGPLTWARVGDGQSNITYKIVRGDDELVLRRGPRPPYPPSAHDMVREATTQLVLRREGVPAPEILDICEDRDVLGVPFYVMSWIDGVVITDRVPPELDSPDQRRETSRALVRALVALHAVDVSTGRPANLGKPDGYLERQIRRFSSIWEDVATRHLPEVMRLASWLDDHRPASQRAAVVHGDYRLGNVMFSRTPSVAPLAILDWELATLGDPLADLGYLTATYSDAGSSRTPLHLSPVTARPGYLTSAELVHEYAKWSHLDVSGLAWYQTLALWKAAIFCEAIYGRWLKGERPGDLTFGPALKEGVPALLAAAGQASRRL